MIVHSSGLFLTFAQNFFTLTYYCDDYDSSCLHCWLWWLC